MVKIPAIGLACGIGGRVGGAEEGPLLLKDRFSSWFDWKEIIRLDSANNQDAYGLIAKGNQKLAEAAFAIASQEPFLLSFGGDHSCAIGTWSGVSAAKRTLGDIGLIWIDAHMDSHTPETSETGNIHGMPLAALMGYGDKRLTQIFHSDPKLKPENIALIGIRSFEEGEANLLTRLGVRIYFMEEVRKRGLDAILPEAIASVSSKTVGYGVSFDLDSLDPEPIQAVGTPEPGGIDPFEMLQAFSHLQEFSPIAFELVEYIPSLDPHFQTFSFIQELLKTIERAAVPTALL